MRWPVARPISAIYGEDARRRPLLSTETTQAEMKTLLALLLTTIITAADIQIIDGDTIRVDGRVHRLVGFDTPDSGERARCQSERELAARATARLQQILAAGKTELKRVACACRPGTEGTSSCNYGRLCAVLTTDGRDVGEILIGEGLAHRYVCGSMGCPRRERWCSN
jgi:endonuclease YncB( thermonuclease family)